MASEHVWSRDQRLQNTEIADQGVGSVPSFVFLIPLLFNCAVRSVTDNVNAYGALTALFSILWLACEARRCREVSIDSTLTYPELISLLCGTFFLSQAFYTLHLCFLLPRLAGIPINRWLLRPGGLVWCGLIGAFSLPEWMSFEMLEALQAVPTIVLPSVLRSCGIDCSVSDLGIVVGDRYYPVAPTCAGTASIGASLFLAIVIIGIRRRPVIQGSFLLLVAVVVAIAANQFRVLSLIALDLTWEGSASNALIHELAGVIVYSLSISALVGFDAWTASGPCRQESSPVTATQTQLRHRIQLSGGSVIAVGCVLAHVISGVMELHRLRQPEYQTAVQRRCDVERDSARRNLDSMPREAGIAVANEQWIPFDESPWKGLWSVGLKLDRTDEMLIVRLDGLFHTPHNLDSCYRIRGDRLMGRQSLADGTEVRHYQTTAGRERLLAYTHVETQRSPWSKSLTATIAWYLTEQSWLSRQVLSASLGPDIYEPGIIQIQVQSIHPIGAISDRTLIDPRQVLAVIRRIVSTES
jgi:exosortase/archaeosortase family protein